MEFKRRTAAILSLSLALVGCYPLEQAPLVYTSKNQFGVTVSSGTADSPGLDANIGFKSLDAAFVPVAVAKKCPEHVTSCEHSIYGIETIYGNNSIGPNSAPVQERIQYLNHVIDSKTLWLTERSQKRDEAQGQLDLLATKSAVDNLLASLSPPKDENGAPRAITPKETAQLAEANAESAKIADILPRKAALEATIARNQKQIDLLKPAIEAAQKELNTLVTQRTDGIDAKKDSLSLYGSFNGGAGATASGASLTLGKVFATGVAAQQIGQGVRGAALSEAIGKCIASVEPAIAQVAAADKDALRERLLKACGVSADSAK